MDDLIILKDENEYFLKDKNKFVGHRGEKINLRAVIIKNNNFILKLL